MKHLGCVSLLAFFLSPVKINAMPRLFRLFLLGKIYSSNFTCKGKDLVCFGFLVGGLRNTFHLCWMNLPSCWWVIRCYTVLSSSPPSWCGSSSKHWSRAVLPHVQGLWAWGAGCSVEWSMWGLHRGGFLSSSCLLLGCSSSFLCVC